MNAEQVMEIMKEAMLVAFEIAGPLLIISIVVGLLVAIFQAATQIHEQTLTEDCGNILMCSSWYLPGWGAWYLSILFFPEKGFPLW